MEGEKKKERKIKKINKLQSMLAFDFMTHRDLSNSQQSNTVTKLVFDLVTRRDLVHLE